MKTKKLITIYRKESFKAFKSVPIKRISEFVDLVFDAYDNGRTVFACGNGGNVASVSNLVIDLNMHPFVSEDKSSQDIIRNKFKAVNLCSDSATITGVSNDLGFEFIFSEQLKFQGNPGDVLLTMSGSGNSKNIIKALIYAKNKGMKTILITRNTPNKAEQYSDLVISLTGTSKFPGQTGGNNNNFHFEDFISKLTHIAVGLLKQKVHDENQSK